jgi:hypothetical protein
LSDDFGTSREVSGHEIHRIFGNRSDRGRNRGDLRCVWQRRVVGGDSRDFRFAIQR